MNKKLSFSQRKVMLRAIHSPFGYVTSGNGISFATIKSLVSAGYLVQDTTCLYEYKPTQSGADTMGVDYQYMLYSQAVDRLDIMEKSLNRVTENKTGRYTESDHDDAVLRVMNAKREIQAIEEAVS